MRETRRRFVALPVLGQALPWVREALAAPVTGEGSQAVRLLGAVSTLGAYIDTLIPADETPSGTALEVDRKLLNRAEGRPDYQRLLHAGLDWLNRQAQVSHGRSFADLGESEREAVVRQAASSEYQSLPRVFFERTRSDAFLFYYGRPESWRGIEQYRGPPQPVGFLDHDKPPRKSR